ncbi:MAG: head decoration protein [Candidatus Nanopelagicales bacterium]
MAVEYVGNIIPSPGFWKGNTSYDPELLYSYARFTQKGVTLAAGQGILPLGTVLAQRTTDKKWVKYDNGGSDGAGVARGVLRRGVDTGTDAQGHTYQGNIVISGILKSQLVVGLDSAAIADLNARLDDSFDTLTF